MNNLILCARKDLKNIRMAKDTFMPIDLLRPNGALLNTMHLNLMIFKYQLNFQYK